MTDAPTHLELVDALWSARRKDAAVGAVPLSLEEGFAVLRQLVGRAVAEGDTVAGWKIARVPGEGGEPFFFAAPVFQSSFDAGSRVGLGDPKLEIELVGRVTAVGGATDGWQFDWHLGVEIVDNHDPAWPLTPGWAIADWGLHAAAVLGDSCAGPDDGQTFSVLVEDGGDRVEAEGAWRTGHGVLSSILQRDCARAARPCRPGDLVWTGALLPPTAFSADRPLRASVEGLGSVTLVPA